MKSKLLLLSALTLGVCAMAQIPTTGLVAHYSFSGNANDQSGNSNNGTVNGATLTTDRFGNTNSAYFFNGTSGYIDVPHSSSLTFTANAISVSFWAKIISVPSSGYNGLILSKQSGSGTSQQGFNLFDNTAQTVGLSIRNGGATVSGSNNYSVTLNQYHHFTYTFNNGTAISYLDGVQTNSVTGQTGTIGANTLNLLIGKASWSNINALNFNGIIDEMQIYNRAITSTEVSQIYAPTTSSFCYDFTYQTAVAEYCPSVIRTSEGGYAFLMTKASSFDIVKTDSLGAIQWQQNYNIGTYGNMQKIIQTSDGGYAAIGQSNLAAYSSGHYCSGVVLKFNSTGVIQWSRQLAGASYGEHNGTDIVQNTNGEYVCSATIQHHADFGGSTEYVSAIVKLSSTGTIIWNKGISATNGAATSITLLTGKQLFSYSI